MACAWGLTGYTTPWKSSSTLRKIAWPTFPGSRDAPITATLRGAKMLDRSRTGAVTLATAGRGSIPIPTSARRVDRPTRVCSASPVFPVSPETKSPRAGGPARGDRRSGLHRLLGHELQRHRREFFHRLLFDDPHRVLHRQPAHLLGLLRDRRGHRPRLDRRQRVADGVKAYDEHLFLPLRGRNGLDGAQRHFIVLREDRVDLFLRLQDVLHDRQPLGAVEVRGLHGDQPDTGVRLQTITKPLP